LTAEGRQTGPVGDEFEPPKQFLFAPPDGVDRIAFRGLCQYA
jgi:hypothetical protein